jgi:HEAT repeat protein
VADYLNGDDSELQEQPDLETTLAALAANKDGAANATIYYGLSHLDAAALPRLAETWAKVAPEIRAKLLSQLLDISEANFDLDYNVLATFALDDEHAEVRGAAVELLWEDESLVLMNRLIEMVEWDESDLVRAKATSELGRFILLGELGDLPEQETARAEDLVLTLLTNDEEAVEVRRRSLEAIANSGHDIVPEVIEEAYRGPDARMQASAVFAMGRTCDNRWNDTVLEAFASHDPALRYEASRASGELEIQEAVPFLATIAQDDDADIRYAAIWALGEIGGNYALKVLGRLADAAEEADDEEMQSAIEESIGIASLAGRELEFDLDD